RFRRRLRQIRWKEWKLPRTRVRMLCFLGIRVSMGTDQSGILANCQKPDLTPRAFHTILAGTGYCVLLRCLAPLSSKRLSEQPMRARMYGGVRSGSRNPTHLLD